MDIQTEKEKLARIAVNLNRENRLEERRIRAKIRAAHEEVRRLVSQFLEIDPGLETIVLFGSLAEDSVFSIDFDIDLAVRSEKYLQVVSCGLKSSFRVDVVDLDHVADPIKASIEKYGKILYEKKKNDLLRLAAELDSDLDLLESLQKKNERALQRVEQGVSVELDWAALGYTIHNIYNLLENYLLHISKHLPIRVGP
jgi:predicted nucleotidyltransferase